jgi:hypothetical protein
VNWSSYVNANVNPNVNANINPNQQTISWFTMPSIFKNLEFLTRVSVSCGFVHSQFSYIFPSFLGYPTWLITSKTRRHVAGCPNHWPLAQGEKYCEPTDVDFTLSDEAELG